MLLLLLCLDSGLYFYVIFENYYLKVNKVTEQTPFWRMEDGGFLLVLLQTVFIFYSEEKVLVYVVVG